ncbi:MAG: CDP-archaeol synthase [Akkermansiaceae bacterium]|nr:CDP-archaeol synthase [Akkermansiaceae bacterium]
MHPMSGDSQAKSPSKAQTFARRLGSTLFLWAVVAGVFLSAWTWAFLGLLSILMIVATLEYFQMLKKAKIPCFPTFGLICSIAFCVLEFGPILFEFRKILPIDALSIPAVLIGCFALQLRHKIEGINALVGVGANLVGFVYFTLMFSFSVHLLFQPILMDASPIDLDLNHLPPSSCILLLWLIAVTKFTDMGAYITGSLIGKHKMIPHVSPGKTWEGFAGGLCFAQVAGFGLYFAFSDHLTILGGPVHVAILGVILALLAVIGDLAASVIKRSLHAKDSGQMLPGIGGSLDLIDSICFTAPALYFYLECLQMTAS